MSNVIKVMSALYMLRKSVNEHRLYVKSIVDALEFPSFMENLRLDTIYPSLSAYSRAATDSYNALLTFEDKFYKMAYVAPLSELESCIFKEMHVYDNSFLMPEAVRERSLCLGLVSTLPSLSEQMDNVVHGLTKFIDLGIPTILAAQQTASARYLTMTTVATFFSAVTATTLQLSYAYIADPHAPLAVSVNALWFVALVFSTASAVNSLLGLTWCQTPRLTLIRQLPRWAAPCLVRGPTISLIVASAAFSVGLCLFAFSSSQHIVTSALTAVFTAAHAVALFALACLYVYDRKQPSLPYRIGIDMRLTWRPVRRIVSRLMRPAFARLVCPIVARFIICRTDWVTLCRRRTCRSAGAPGDVEQAPGNIRRAPGANTEAEIQHKLRRSIVTPVDPRELRIKTDFQMMVDTRVQDKRTAIVTESPGVTLFRGPRTPICGDTDSDESKVLASGEPGEEDGRGFFDYQALLSAQRSIAATSPTVDFSPGPSSSSTARTLGIGPENTWKYEEDIPGRLYRLQEGSPEWFDFLAMYTGEDAEVARQHNPRT
ncbi:hypothetical protein M0805_005183 [Coniferiporia weirii]|nr:hypothetical protein M0805_005183 [Coniferiporia weirii]